jgi:DNA-binding transcriptional ArsR family regulator
MHAEHASTVSRSLAALSHADRIRLISALARGERGSGELAAELSLDGPAVQSHLAPLIDARIVQGSQCGREMIYAMPPSVHHRDSHPSGPKDTLRRGPATVTFFFGSDLELAMAFRMAHGLKALCDAERLRILGVLAQGEVRLADLADALSIDETRSSHQLSILRSAGYVAGRFDGKASSYSMKPGVYHRQSDAMAPRHVFDLDVTQISVPV